MTGQSKRGWRVQEFVSGNFRTLSVAVQSREAISMKVRVAEKLLADAHALHEQADIEFVGHSDTTVHLYALLHC